MAVEPKLPQQKPTSQQGPSRSVVDLHLWQITPIRDAFWIGLGIAVLLFTYYLRSIFTPVLIGLMLAYIFNPMICYFEERWRVPRPVTISAILVLLVVLLVVLSVWVIPTLMSEAFSLLSNIPKYVRTVIHELEQKHVRIGTLESIHNLTTLPQGNPQDMMQTLFNWTSEAFGYIGTVIATSTYVILTMILIPIYFFSFAWQFEPILRKVRDHIPPRHRERTLDILHQMDNAVSGFFRGRLTVAFIMSAVFMLGWRLADVPYWFLLGIVAAVLNIVPYLVIVVWPLAVLLKWLNVSVAATTAAASTQAAASATVGAVAAATQALATQPAATQAASSQAAGVSWDWLYLAIGPTIAYLVAQFLDNWFITPIIQSRSSNLSAVTIMIVVLVGGAVGGLYGLLLAIPVASCAKILAKEVLIPHLQKWAQEE